MDKDGDHVFVTYWYYIGFWRKHGNTFHASFCKGLGQDLQNLAKHASWTKLQRKPPLPPGEGWGEGIKKVMILRHT